MSNEECSKVISRILYDRQKSDIHSTDLLPESQIENIIKSVTKILRDEDLLLHVGGNFVVVGDIHGDMDSLLHIFLKEGYPPQKSYIFLGDYIDRGSFSMEVLILLYCFKIKFPKNIYLLQGNHETKNSIRKYGFRQDCIYRLNRSIYKSFLKSFDQLPIAAVVNDRYLCLHGGISPKFRQLDQISKLNKLNKNCGIIHDILWSDPSNSISHFGESPRKQGYAFGPLALKQFLNLNGLEAIIRGHSFIPSGHQWDFEGCLTVFSSSNYLSQNNSASFILLQNNEIFCKNFLPNQISNKIISPDFLFEESKNSIKIDPILTNFNQNLLENIFSETFFVN